MYFPREYKAIWKENLTVYQKSLRAFFQATQAFNCNSGIERSTMKFIVIIFLVAPVFDKPLQNRTVVEGDRVLFKCYASGSPSPDVTWYKNGKVINKSGPFSIIERCVKLFSLSLFRI